MKSFLIAKKEIIIKIQKATLHLFFIFFLCLMLNSLASAFYEQKDLIEPVFMSCSTGLDQVDNFTPSCFRLGTTIPARASLWDPEFSADSKYAIWMNGPPRKIKRGREKIFIAPLDPDTGDIIGEATQQIKGIKPVYYTLIGNGPEWGFSLRAGAEGYFSSFSQDGKTLEVHRFTLDPRTNAWFASVLPNSRGMSFRRASQNPADFVPKLYLQTISSRNAGLGPAIWREDIDHPFDQILDNKGGRGDWIRGTNKLLFTNIFGNRGSETRKDIPTIYDTETNSQDYLFEEPKKIGHLRAWQAPELHGKLFVAIVVRQNDYSIIELYKKEDNGEWKLVSIIESIDPEFPHIFKFEPFVFKGKSYIAMIMYPRLWGSERIRGHQPAKIGLVGDVLLSNDQRLKRIISLDKSKVSIKIDIEVLSIKKGTEVRLIYADYPVD